MIPMRLNLPYLSQERNRHGQECLYVRRFGRRVRLLEVPGSPDFMVAYAEAVQELSGRRPVRTVPELKPYPAGTLGWLGARYFDSAEFRRIDPISQATRRGILESCFREPFKDDPTKPLGGCPLPQVTTQKIKWLRDRKAETPGAANNRRKYLSALFGWAVEAGHIASNPARDVRRIRYASEGFYTWSAEDVRRFEIRWRVGTKPRLALGLLLFSGVRRGDLVRLGRQHARDGWLRFVPNKTRYKRHTISEKPILPQLADIIAKSPTGDLTFLVTEYGKPFTAAGFGGWFAARCDEAGVRGRAHGLRKAGATIAAENGATVHQLMAIYDWTTIAQAQKYIEAVNRKRLAGEGMALLGRAGT
jgi:integrase